MARCSSRVDPMEDNFARYIQEAAAADPTDRATFSRLLRDGRALAGMSLRDAAGEFRTAPGTVSRWENGYCAPPVIARREIIWQLSARIHTKDEQWLRTHPE